jgi:hypothetical protein
MGHMNQVAIHLEMDATKNGLIIYSNMDWDFFVYSYPNSFQKYLIKF